MTKRKRTPKPNSAASIALTFIVGGLIAFNMLSEAKKALYGPHADVIVSVLLGGFYAVEKLRQLPWHNDGTGNGDRHGDTDLQHND